MDMQLFLRNIVGMPDEDVSLMICNMLQIVNWLNNHQKITACVDILDENDVYTVEMLLELTENDYVDMGLGRALVRTMLRKAREAIVQSSSSSPVKSFKMMLIPMEHSLDAEYENPV